MNLSLIPTVYFVLFFSLFNGNAKNTRNLIDVSQTPVPETNSSRNASKGNSTEWKMLWLDNFDGKKLNNKNWTKIPRGNSDWNRHMSDNEDCYEINDGILTLKGLPNNGIIPNDATPYLTGGVYTKNKQYMKYGKIEIKAKLKNAQGAWPAIWMLSDEPIEKGGQLYHYPYNGEIDNMDHLNYDDKIYSTIHNHYTLNLKTLEPFNSATNSLKNDQLNIYALECYPDKLVFSINGIQTFTYPRVEPAVEWQWTFDCPFFLLIDMQLGGSWVGAVDPLTLPSSTMIDWVKVYKHK